MFQPPSTHQTPSQIAPDTFVIHDHSGEGTAPVMVPLNSMVIRSREPIVVDTGVPTNRERFFADLFGIVEPEDDLVRGCRQFAAMRLSMVTVAHSSSSLLGGKGWDEATVAALSPLLGAGTRLTTNGLDTFAALRACKVRRPFLVLPPWFNDQTVAAGIAYYADCGFAPAGHLRYDPGRKWRELPPGDLVGLGAGFEQEVEPLYAQIRAACPADAVPEVRQEVHFVAQSRGGRGAARELVELCLKASGRWDDAVGLMKRSDKKSGRVG